MEINTMYNQEVVRAGLRRRAEARREAIRKEAEAHENFERAMIKTVNENAENARKRDGALRGLTIVKPAAKKPRRTVGSKKEIQRAVAEGSDYLLKMWVCIGAFAITGLLRLIGAMPLDTAIGISVLLAALFAYVVHELYEISGAIAELTTEE